MSADDTARKLPEGRPPSREKAARSGEGASTALEAMIRKRKQAENPEGDSLLPPLPDGESILPPLPDADPDPATSR
jgi:hypothetical protein